MDQQLHKYENLLNREFHTDKPNSKWVTDISYIHTRQLQLHSDQGFQYTSQAYFNLTKEYGHYALHVKTWKPV